MNFQESFVHGSPDMISAGIQIWRIGWPLFLLQTSLADIVDRHVLCAQSPHISLNLLLSPAAVVSIFNKYEKALRETQTLRARWL